MLNATRHRPIANVADEAGAVLILFALFSTVIVLFLSFVIDVGNWFAHQRHLQLQADAAAFAAASEFQYPCTATIARKMYSAAGWYGGAEKVTAPVSKGFFATFAAEPDEFERAHDPATTLHNQQIGGTSQENIHEEINKKAYFGQSLGTALAETTTVENAPCEPEADMVDVKMTETNLPWFFKALNVPDINAHARVSIKAETTASKVEPIIESEPVEVRVFYLNDTRCRIKGKKEYENCADGEHSAKCRRLEAEECMSYENEVLATGLLTEASANEENGTVTWNDEHNTVPLTIGKVTHIGVRFALAGEKGVLEGKAGEEPSICFHKYVECFDEDDGVTPPILNIQGYSAEAEGTAEKPWNPVTRQVTLTTQPGNTCEDAYFNKLPLSEREKTCTITLLAEVNYGKESTNPAGIKVIPKLVYTEGFTNHRTELTQSKLEYKGGEWEGTLNIPSYYYGNFGSSEIDLTISCEPQPKAKNACEKATKTETATLTDVQRDFSAGPDGSNRVVGARVFEPGGAKPFPGERDADAFEYCEKTDEETGVGCTHKLAVSIELSGSLQDAKKYFNSEGKPIPAFHVLYGDNDQDGDDQFVVACPPTTNPKGIVPPFELSAQYGCEGKYSVDPKQTEASCKEELTPGSSHCLGLVDVEEGTENFKGRTEGERAEELTAAFQHYVAKRMEGEINGTRFYCPSNWQNNNGGGIPTIPANDSRLLQFFVVPFTVTTFERKGEVSPLIPIENFATFYVTGWGNGNYNVGQGSGVYWNPKERRDGCSEKLFHQESPWKWEGKSVGPLTETERNELENESIPLRTREQKEKEKGFDEDIEQPREVVGHLIKYVNVLGEGSGSVTCKQESYETCEEKLTE